MKLAIVPALALAAGGAALMASPASATPEVNRHAVSPQATPDMKRYGNHGHDHDHDHDQPATCLSYKHTDGLNVLSHIYFNDFIDAPVDVIVQVITLLTTADITSDKPIDNSQCAG